MRFLYIGNEWNQKNDNNEKSIFNFMFSFCVLQLHYIYMQQINQENYYSFRVHFIQTGLIEVNNILITKNCYLNINLPQREIVYAFKKYYKQGHCITETGLIQFVDSLGDLFIFIDDVFELKNKMRLSELIDVRLAQFLKKSYAGITYLGGGTFMYNFRVYTLRDGSKRIIKLKEGESFKEELQRAGIQEKQIFQMQLVEKPK